MSHELLLTPGRFGTPERLRSYFTGRPFTGWDDEYKIAFYENPDTGVYFLFECDAVSDSSPGPVVFVLNYIRAEPFGLEAEPEVASFIHHFAATVEDPQSEEGAEYSRKAFLESWRRNNDAAIRTIADDPEYPKAGYVSLPAAEIARAWRWNFRREALQEEVSRDEDLFVAKLSTWVIEGRAGFGCVWTDGLPAILPRADFVLVHRDEFAPRRWLRHTPDTVPLPFEEVRHILREVFEKAEIEGHECYRLSEDDDLVGRAQACVKRLPAGSRSFTVATDKVLPSEKVSF